MKQSKQRFRSSVMAGLVGFSALSAQTFAQESSVAADEQAAPENVELNVELSAHRGLPGHFELLINSTSDLVEVGLIQGTNSYIPAIEVEAAGSISRSYGLTSTVAPKVDDVIMIQARDSQSRELLISEFVVRSVGNRSPEIDWVSTDRLDPEVTEVPEIYLSNQQIAGGQPLDFSAEESSLPPVGHLTRKRIFGRSSSSQTTYSRSTSQTYSPANSSRPSYSSQGSSGSAQQIAQARANAMASRGYKGHPNWAGSPFGGGVGFEGVGFSSSGPNAPTCVGRGSVVADAVAKGADGWYRVRLYSH